MRDTLVPSDKAYLVSSTKPVKKTAEQFRTLEMGAVTSTAVKMSIDQSTE